MWNHRGKTAWHWPRSLFLRYVTQTTSNRKKNRHVRLHQKASVQQRKYLEDRKVNLQNSRNYLQIIYLIKVSKYKLDPYNWITRKQIIWVKKEQRIWTDISPHTQMTVIYKKVLNITNYQGIASQNHNKLSITCTCFGRQQVKHQF